jgi:hypothetical protein
MNNHFSANCDLKGHNILGPIHVNSSRSTSKIFYVETLATTIRAISGLSRQTAVSADDKVGQVENMPLDKIQCRAIDLRPLRLHEIEHKGRRILTVGLH